MGLQAIVQQVGALYCYLHMDLGCLNRLRLSLCKSLSLSGTQKQQ